MSTTWKAAELKIVLWFLTTKAVQYNADTDDPVRRAGTTCIWSLNEALSMMDQLDLILPEQRSVQVLSLDEAIPAAMAVLGCPLPFHQEEEVETPPQASRLGSLVGRSRKDPTEPSIGLLLLSRGVVPRTSQEDRNPLLFASGDGTNISTFAFAVGPEMARRASARGRNGRAPPCSLA